MRAIVTGQVGMNKKEYLQGVVDHAGEQGESVKLFNVGDMMYAEGRDITKGRILDLPWSRLNSLRRAAFEALEAPAERVAITALDGGPSAQDTERSR